MGNLVDSLLDEPASKPVFAMEPSGHYYEPLAHAISQSYGPEQVYLVQASYVSRRRQHWNRAVSRTTRWMPASSPSCCSWVMVGPIGSSKGSTWMYHLERYRWAQEQASTRLKNQSQPPAAAGPGAPEPPGTGDTTQAEDSATSASRGSREGAR